MTHRGPFQPVLFCDSVSKTGMYKLIDSSAEINTRIAANVKCTGITRMFFLGISRQTVSMTVKSLSPALNLTTNHLERFPWLSFCFG